MLPFLGEYLSPTNPIALGIITFLMGFFLVWLIGLIRYWYWLWIEQKHIENNKNIRPLVTARQERDRGRKDNNQKTDPENVFNEFCNESSLNRRSPIANHLKAIFLAGWDETRLEVGELINHTTSALFKWNNLFRSMLAVFIVIGLLGTLFGLTDSLTRLSPVLNERAANQTSIENNDLEESTVNEAAKQNNEKMTKVLSDLFNDIEGAFAPSILGIFFTIVGVIFYGIYLQSACHPVKSMLERLTLTVWVPQLYPTTTQKLNQTLQQSESQMQKGFETAAQFSESVQKVEDNISEFNESLTQARAITQPLSDSVTQINKAASDIGTAADTLNTGFTENLDTFSKEFTSSVTHLTGFQDEIRDLHQHFQEAANQKLNQFQEAANQKLDQQIETLNKQDQNLTTTVEVLKNSEKLYIDSCQQIDNTLQEFLKKTTEASEHIETTNKHFLEGINTRNREWLAEIQTQLKADLAIIQPTLKAELTTLTEQLTSDLKEVQGTLDERLTGLTEQLKFFQLPIEKTADQIEGIIESFTRIIAGVVNDLKSEFQKQSTKIEEQSQRYEAQLTGVKSLNENVVNLLNQLNESSKNQKDAFDALDSNINGLTEDTKHLATVITSFVSDSGTLSQSIAAIEEHTETLGTASQQFVEKTEKADITPLIANIERLNIAVDGISQNSRALTDAVNTLTRQIDASGESSSIQGKFSLLERIQILLRGKPVTKRTSEKYQSEKKQG